MWRYRELMPLFDGETPVSLGEGFTPLFHATTLGSSARPRAAVRQGRVAQPDELVQGTRTIGGDHAREASWGATIAPSDRRQRRQRGRGVRSRRRACVRSLHAQGREAAICRRVPPLRRRVTLVDGLITDAGRVAANGARRSAGTTSPHSRSRTGSRARRRWPTSLPSRWPGSGRTGSCIRPAAAPA